MTASWTPLPWDSDFFGISIGKVDLDGADERTILELEADARAAGVVCLYGSANPADRELTYLAQVLRWRFVDAATLFKLRVDEPPIPRPPEVTFRLGTADDLPALTDIVAKLADWSRFAVDPRFGRKAALRLQQAWVERAATSTTGEHALMVAEATSGIVSFITRATHPHPVVDTVGAMARGPGSARYLIQEARSWAGDQPLLGGPIAARNVSALRYVSHCGYRVKSVRYLYHRWLDEDGAVAR